MFGISRIVSRWLQKRPPDESANVESPQSLSVDAIERNIPYYLTEEAKQGLVKALRGFPDNLQYYTLFGKNELLQGDCWTKFQIFNFKNGSRATIRGIVLSNSCDISPENRRDLPPTIVFAPLIRLSDYIAALKRAGAVQAKIDQTVRSIRNQEVTNIFYMPNGFLMDEEYIARLDDLHSMPLKVFLDEDQRRKIVTLSQAGFYVFLFKLSVHFCRFHENVDRASAAT
jgi:hypothetical protein